ncbi:ParB/RepB/Spo0J family partition protein [Variovorax paradoxus]|uniref:ParB/RepB/Spo0J family partition protein n=1 Tax=Variovorax paradoxus TaxID=34073 RepID=UPI003D655E96
MSAHESLDLSMLSQFKASALLEGAPLHMEEGAPMQVPLPLIDFDPMQPRSTVDEATLDELAASIRTHGVLEPVSLRRSTEAEGRYIVNRGERRVRAARRIGLGAIPAFLDERVDPYAQAAENLHREGLSPFDLARFIAEREKEGHSRAEIARRLNKPRSFISEAAALIDAPAPVRAAFDAGRLGADLRVLYQLARAARTEPLRAAALLEGDGLITRGAVDWIRDVGVARQAPPALPPARAPVAQRPANSGGRTVLVVEHRGRRGSLRLKARDNDMAEVRFGDGSRDLIKLVELRLVCWATEEPSA